MDEANGKQPPRFRLSGLFWIGVVVFALGSGPLLITVLLARLGLTGDPNPNPVGFGIMAMLTFYPSIALVLGGLATSIVRYRSQRKRFNNHAA